MSAKKGKGFDLSNVGGQPKDWLQRGSEYDAEFSWWDDIKMTAGFVALPAIILGGIGYFLYSLLKYAGKS